MNIRLWFIGLVAVLTSAGYGQQTVHVSTAGNDLWSGQLPQVNEANTDGPKRTLAGARDELRVRRALNPLAWKGATVLVQPGTYYMSETLLLDESDAGDAEYPIVYRSDSTGQVTIDGGIPLTNWTSVPVSVSRFLNAKARARVVACDLNQAGVTDLGAFSKRGPFNQPTSTVPELFYGNRRMTIARWPNSDWLRVPDDHSGSYTEFRITDPRPTTWSFNSDIWAHGYFMQNWADYYEKIKTIDPTTMMVALDNPIWHGIKAKQRYHFLNVLEELDEPGEYYIDRQRKMLYFYAPKTRTEVQAVLGALDAPLIKYNGASYVRFEDMTFQNTRRNAIEIRKGTGNVIVGSTIRNIGGVGVYIAYGYENGVDSCNIFETGEDGVVLAGGDRYTLTPGLNFVTNSYFRSTSVIGKTFHPAIRVRGNGNIVRNNLVTDLPHIAIMIDGNNQLLEYNEIAHACQETGDSAAVNMGQDFSEQGNVLQYNLFRDLRGSESATSIGPNEVYAVGLDDIASGTTVRNNIFRRVDFGLGIGGGRDNTIENNLFDEVKTAVFAGFRPEIVFSIWNLQAKLDDVKHTLPPYSVAYPLLANLLNDQPMTPKRNVLQNNVYINLPNPELGIYFLRMFTGMVCAENDGAGVNVVNRHNYIGMTPGFVDLHAYDLRFVANAPGASSGFQPIEAHRIGLYTNIHRRYVPELGR